MRRLSPSVCVVVAVGIVCAVLAVLLVEGRGGPDPAKWLLHQCGFVALCALVASLAVTPLRRRLRAPSLAAWRRPVGLAAFFLVALHVVVYATVYQGFAWHPVLDDVVRRPYILLGALAFLLLVPMAMTSTRRMQRRLGRRWNTLHRAIYFVVPLAIVHQGMSQKADLGETLVFSAFAGCFLVERAVFALRVRATAKKS